MDFLAKKRRGDPPGVVVAFGDSGLLLRSAERAVRHWVLGNEPSEMSLSLFSGSTAVGRDVLDELFMPPFLGDKRLVIVNDADDFVSENRQALEKVVSSPSQVGVLLLTVKSWPSNTRLAKAVPLAIDCQTPKAHFVAGWCIKWADQQYQKVLDRPLAEWLVELVGTELGVLDQEIAKLATSAGDQPSISREAIQTLVAGSRVDTAFTMLDAALEGNTARALHLFDRLTTSGEHPVAILSMLMASLRKLALAGRASQRGQPLDQALREAGVLPFLVAKYVQQFHRLGKERISKLSRRMLKTDLDLKGGSALPSRTVLERLLIALARRA
jgi:DNA polymerase-3 subunit delta